MGADTLKRLRALTREAGSATAHETPKPPVQSAADETLAQLRRMQGRRRPRNPAADRRPGPAATEAELAERVGGEPLADGLIRIRSRHPLPDHWQNGPLGLPGHRVSDAGGLVFMDTETTGLAGGSGTLAFLVGLLRPREDALHLEQYLITRYAAEAPMLGQIRQALSADASMWVTYNGKSYDLPLLETRSRLQGQGAWPLLEGHLDLMHGVRRGFADRWSDCRLVTAENRLLGIQRHDDLPGAEAPEAWFRYLRVGDAGRLVRVVDHNRQDLLSLAGLLPVVARLHEDPATYGANPLTVARHLCRVSGRTAPGLALLRASRPLLNTEGLLELARWARREGHVDLAVEIWEEQATAGNQAAIEALAKHLEHSRRDYRAALELARRLRPHHRHSARLARLTAKVERQTGTHGPVC